MNAKAVVVAVLLVAGAGFAWYATQNRGPSTNTQGAIAAADRYQEGQISGSDIKLTDPAVQSFLQSDTFHKIQTDASFRKLVTSEQFREALQVDAFVGALQDYASGGTMTADYQDQGKISPDYQDKGKISPDYQDKGKISPDYQDKGKISPDYQEKGKISPDFQDKKRVSPDFEDRKRISPDWDDRKRISPDWENRGIRIAPDHRPLKKFVDNYQVVARRVPADVWASLAANRNFRKLVLDKSFNSVVSTEGFSAAMDAMNRQRAELAKGGAENAKFKFSEALSATPEGQRIAASMEGLMADAASREVLESAEFSAAFSAPEAARFVTSAGVTDLARYPELWAFANSAGMLNALSDQNVASIVADGSLLNVVWNPDGAAVLNADVFQKIVTSNNPELMSAVTSE